MQKHSVFVWAAIVLSVIALLLQFLAVCLPHWQWYDNMPSVPGGILHGLFSMCAMMGDGGTICRMHNTIPAWLNVVRTFEMFGLVLLFIVAVLLTLYLLLLQWKVVVHVIFIVTLFVIVFFLLIGVSVYGHNADADHLHVGYAFAVIAAIVTAVPAILLIVMCSCRREKTFWVDQEHAETYDRAYNATEMHSSTSRRSSKVEPVNDSQQQRAESRQSQADNGQAKELLE
ncbi:uncharacterized protein LOC110460519 [Mizuhopecten yessoensis]|uniref:Uncharacterized protein n=1 Tax=Mizuhopecten yessoensis TaxID=6573 RepID=A0A210Q2A1_MIZYE|nr:uncharacterized protein LOC110460519 [Mizuhopecten yessoensis]OWF42866.1 hypothetical protein KP79_PYT17864 [Mizuhopecten yessoensis]